MIKKLIIFIVFISSITGLYAQSGWITQYSNATKRVYDFYFLNQNTGWTSVSAGYLHYSTILKTTNGGASWDSIPTSENQAINKIYFLNENTGWASVQVEAGANGTNSKIIKSTNGGLNWSVIFDMGYPNITSITALNKDTVFFSMGKGFDCCYAGGILKTTNGGINFTSFSYPLDTYIYKVQFTSNQTGWATIFFRNNSKNVLLKTTNNGQNWNFIRYTDSTHSYLDFYFLSDNTGYIIQNNIFLKTTDGGVNWFDSGTPNQANLYNLFMLSENTGWIAAYISTDNARICKTTNGGITWQYNTIGIAGFMSSYYKLQFVNDRIGWFGGSTSNNPMGSLFKTTNGGTVTGFVSGNTEPPIDFSLSQNYPNPFNPNTEIKWEVPVSGFVSLKVFDAIGNEIETLVNEYQNTGNYSVNFDGSKLPSGVYFYKLTAGNFSETKRMVLIK